MSINRVTITGNLTENPRLGETKGGTEVANLRVAVQRRKRDGEDQGAVFIDVAVYGNQAGPCSRYLTKGSKVGVDGRLEQQEWQDRESGQKRSRHELVAQEVEFLSARKSSDAEEPTEPSSDASDSSTPEAHPATAGAAA